MKQEDALKMIELCLEACDAIALKYLTELIIEKRIDLATPKKRVYSKKDLASTGQLNKIVSHELNAAHYLKTTEGAK